VNGVAVIVPKEHAANVRGLVIDYVRSELFETGFQIRKARTE
jgi:hypothetical protein